MLKGISRSPTSETILTWHWNTLPLTADGSGNKGAHSAIQSNCAMSPFISPRSNISGRPFRPAQSSSLPDAGHFCQEDQPALLVALIEQFVQLT